MDQVAFLLLGKLAAWIGSVLAAVWGVLRFLPKQWFQHQFDKKLEQFKAAHDRELEQLRADHAAELQDARHRLDILLRQTSKLHDKEFDVLADAWEKLNEALGHVSRLVSAFQSFPALDRLDETHFQAFVDNSKLEEVDKQELLGKLPRDRMKFYEERIFWYRLRDARGACTELHRTIERNSIFLDPAIGGLFRKIDNLAWTTLTSRAIGAEANDHRIWRDAGQKFTDEVVPLKNEIERRVQERLGHERSPPAA